jgi:hypothetical protein
VVGVVLAEAFRLGVPHYKIRWEGMPSGSDTLEHAYHLQDHASQAVIHAYRKSRSCDDDDGASRDAAKESAFVAVPLSLLACRSLALHSAKAFRYPALPSPSTRTRTGKRGEARPCIKCLVTLQT